MKSNNNEQIERLKKICLDKHFETGGDIYKLLEKDILVKLLNERPISKGEVKLTSSFVYGRDTITTEEKFIENLNRYIGFVRDNYYICHVEQLMLVELSLTTPYVDVLYSTLDFHKDKNYEYYDNNFRRLFFTTFYTNIMHYADDENIDTDYKKFIEEIKDYDYENDEDIIELDKILTEVINIRRDNLYQAFLPYTEYERNGLFHIEQINWIISNYYKVKNKKEDIKITNVRLICDDKPIIDSNISRELKGYIVKNIDSWYYEITYILDDKEKVEILKFTNESEENGGIIYEQKH